MSIGDFIEIDYRNWRGERGKRLVRIISWRFGTTDWHHTPGWLFLAYCVKSGDEREFSLMGLHDIQLAPTVQSTSSADNAIAL